MTTKRTQDSNASNARKDEEKREKTGHAAHVSEKFCRYTTWKVNENAILRGGRASVNASKTCIDIVTGDDIAR